MNYTFEDEYLDLLTYIRDKGEKRADRTGTGTIAIFGTSIDVDLRQGFPILTTKAVPFKSVAAELLWFIEGSGDERRLAEITHGTRDRSTRTIWTPNADGTTGASYQPKFYGDLGRIYGVQWRKWAAAKLLSSTDQLIGDTSKTTHFGATVELSQVDQLKQLIDDIKKSPTGRRHLLTAWNPGELNEMSLPPCHMFAQFYVSNNGELDCQMYQRSVDTVLGLPFNIASYALLTHLIAQCTGTTPRHLKLVLGDTHIYLDHLEGVEEQLKREVKSPPTLHIKSDCTDIDDFKLADFELEGYDPAPAIKLRMSA